MTKNVDTKFATGSSYSGTYHSMIHEIEGYGQYTFPNGSHYRGYFRKGLFHGPGTLTQAKPYAVTYVGIFEEGKLKEIDRIMFEDGLYFDIDMNHKTGDFTAENWRYLSAKDRRFVREVANGWTNDQFTARKKDRTVLRGAYDVEEGFFNPKTGFISHIPRPFRHTRFAKSRAEIDWIKENCRYGGKVFAHSERSQFGTPIHPICQKIIKNNQEVLQQLERLIDDDPTMSENCPCSNTYHQFDHVEEGSSSQRGDCFLTSSMRSGESMSSLESALQRNQILVDCPPSTETEYREDVVEITKKLASARNLLSLLKKELEEQDSEGSEEGCATGLKDEDRFQLH